MNLFEGQKSGALESRRDKLLVIFSILLLIFLVRLFYLQVVKHKYYEKLALTNRIQREKVIAPRGLILDRDGRKLVANMPVYQINILPKTALKRERQFELACRLLGIDVGKLRSSISAWLEKYPDGREMTVVQSANKKQISILKENQLLFPFFKLVMKPRRIYPEGSLAAHVLGYIGEVTEEDLKRDRKLARGDITGKTGVELTYNRYLTGIDGVKVVEVSADGAVIGEIDYISTDNSGIGGSKPPVPGSDVYLTIDVDLQRIVEEAFRWDKGAVVVMNPNNGEILAATSRPWYNPNMFLKGFTGEEWKELNSDPSKPLFNRTVQALYPPGSVFKLVTAYSALVNGIVSPRQRLKPCFGSYRFGNRYFRCWKSEGHGLLNLHDAIVQSCDVFFYQLGEKLSADQFYESGRLFGLGERTGVDLPGEAKGILPNRHYYDRKYGKRKWTQGLMLNYSIGQGEILATPLQLALLCSIFANGGKMVKPHIVSKVVDPSGNIIYSGNSWESPIKGLNKDALRFIRSAMVDVVHGEHGTGRAAMVMGVKIAGKTGTAQNPHGEDHAVFIAYAPVENPRLAISIVMENAGHGGAFAAPVAREIILRYFSEVRH